MLKLPIRIIHSLLDKYPRIPFDSVQYTYLLVIQTVHFQQEYMHKNRLKSIKHRIVSIHQPWSGGKRHAKVEFGAKIQVSWMNGLFFLDDLSWDAFAEGAPDYWRQLKNTKNALGMIRQRCWLIKYIVRGKIEGFSKNWVSNCEPSRWVDPVPVR